MLSLYHPKSKLGGRTGSVWFFMVKLIQNLKYSFVLLNINLLTQCIFIMISSKYFKKRVIKILILIALQIL